MPVRLEPAYLANVLLFVDDVETVKAFPFVSKSCLEATLTLKVNPGAFCFEPRSILKFFPNINTMVVESLMYFKKTDALPDTVTALVVQQLFSDDLTDSSIRVADRVVEIQGFSPVTDPHPTDSTFFANLKRLALNGVPDRLTLPSHTLKRLTVTPGQWDGDLFARFPPECAEQVVIVFDSRRVFLEAKARPLPPNVRVFCNNVGEGIAPEDVFGWWSREASRSPRPLASTTSARSTRASRSRSAS